MPTDTETYAAEEAVCTYWRVVFTQNGERIEDVFFARSSDQVRDKLFPLRHRNAEILNVSLMPTGALNAWFRRNRP